MATQHADTMRLGALWQAEARRFCRAAFVSLVGSSAPNDSQNRHMARKGSLRDPDFKSTTHATDTPKNTNLTGPMQAHKALTGLVHFLIMSAERVTGAGLLTMSPFECSDLSEAANDRGQMGVCLAKQMNFTD